MKELLELIAKNLVKHPGAVRVNGMSDSRSVCYQVSVIRADRGMLIGKDGVTIKAINHIIHCAHKKDGLNASVEIVEEA